METEVTARPVLWSDEPDPRLRASRDLITGEVIFPAVPDGSPLARRHEPIALESEGRVYSFTVIHPGAKSGHKPYALGYVDLPGPVRIFGRLQGTDRPAIGDRCHARRDAAFGYVFEHCGESTDNHQGVGS
jgi:uncharacterized OB-fold protein